MFQTDQDVSSPSYIHCLAYCVILFCKYNEKLWAYCKLPKTQPTGLRFHKFAMFWTIDISISK